MSILHISVSHAEQPAKLAIVLDDMGYNHHDLQALSLPSQITLSILPYTPYAKKIAQIASQQEREFLLHVPMEAKIHNEKLGKGALLLGMHEQEFKTELINAIAYLPNATGVNNHMGSALTEQVKQMQWTMEILADSGLYFLDSRTTAKTVAEETANATGVAVLRRHVFLDNIKTTEAMDKQFLTALKLAKKQNSVVIIAHPYPETIQFLNRKLNQPSAQLELVPLQALLSSTERQKLSNKKRQQVDPLIINKAIKMQAPHLH